ncbi:YaaC-like protein [Kribbella jejuensis]|uniref:YaaC-like protein n=2 Tax=Kribbella jejuensis TaxID=236068 RepID=A0A542EQ70_9ACTN|nr:YaaC-like protein [Kribbella jejuensis]
MSIRPARPYSNWVLVPPSTAGGMTVGESASVAYILETLGTHSEIAKVGRARFPGTIAERNALWREFRNYTRQAISNFQAAQLVPNRSAALLYYYAMMNFAKAELLDTHAGNIVDRRIGHGLSFSPTAAKTVSGDALIVRDGIFRLLYERRLGKTIRIGERLPVARLLTQIPEIASQLSTVDGGTCQVSGLFQMLARDAEQAWSLIAIADPGIPSGNNATRKLLARNFEEVERPPDWRDHFALSRAFSRSLTFHESLRKIDARGVNAIPVSTTRIIFDIDDILGTQSSEDSDAWIAPSLYKTRMLPMPPAFARYALTYYASSLVRYKPQMFDSQLHPEQAYLFDAIARELAVPMLQDTLSAISQKTVLFRRAGSWRT